MPSACFAGQPRVSVEPASVRPDYRSHRRSVTAEMAIRPHLWKASLTEAAVRLQRRGERGYELAPRSASRRPLRLSNEQRRGHHPGSLLKIVQLDTDDSGRPRACSAYESDSAGVLAGGTG
jgi:hypothetical protein